MTEKKKSNKVSWASGSKLCQVKHIRKADRPHKVSQKVRKISHRKKPSNFPTSCPSAYVPFKKEPNVNQNQIKEKLPKILQIKWEIPPTFVLESDWLVASGEESEETSPFTLSDVEDQCFNDSKTRIIPIIPIEQADSCSMSPPKTLNNNNMLPSKNSKSAPPPMEGDTLPAAVATITAIMRSNDPRSLIDTDLLVKFLKDPELTLQLINERRLVSNNVSGRGPYESKTFLEPCNNTKDIEEEVVVSVPMLTNPSGQPSKTPGGGGSIVDVLPSEKYIGSKSEIINMATTPIAGSRFESCFTFKPGHIMQTETNAKNVVPPIIKPLFKPIMPTEKQPLFKPIMPAGLPFGTSFDPVLNFELKDGHGAHDDHVAVRINPPPLAGNHVQVQPDLSVIKRMIRDYGLSDDSQHMIHGPTQQSEPLGASNISTKTNEPPLKYLSYHQLLIKQHGEIKKEWDPHTQSNNQNYLHNIHKPKTQEACFYFNTPKGCRNGSRCLFRHESFNQQRPTPTATATSGAPDAKRMKLGLGKELIGRT